MKSSQSKFFEHLVVSSLVQQHDGGMYATQLIKKGTTLFQIPERQALSFSNIDNEFVHLFHPLKQTMTKQKLLFSKTFQQIVLSIYLIVLKVQIAPKHHLTERWLSRNTSGFLSFDSTQIRKFNEDLNIEYWANKNQQSKQSKCLYDLLTREGFFSKKYPLIKSLTSAQFQSLWFWSNQFQNTRSFGYKDQTVLIPRFDFVNHSSHNKNIFFGNTDQPNSEGESSESSDNDSEEGQPEISSQEGKITDGIFYMQALKDIEKGQQLYLSYGHRNNEYLLKWYGFIELKNPFDSLKIYLSAYSDDIYFDSIERPTYLCKLKRKVFNVALLKHFKRQYYPVYFKKQPSFNYLWTIPIHKQFECFWISKAVQRLKNHCPPQFVSGSQSQGGIILEVYSSERIHIYQEQLLYFSCLLQNAESILKGGTLQPISSFPQPISSFPSNLQQYLSLLSSIK